MDSPELYRWEYRCGGVNVMAEAGWLNASIPFTAVWRVYFENAMVIYDGNTVTAYPHGSEPVVFDTEEAVKIPTGINVPHRLVLRRAGALPVLHSGGKALPWCPGSASWRCWACWRPPWRRTDQTEKRSPRVNRAGAFSLSKSLFDRLPDFLTL